MKYYIMLKHRRSSRAWYRGYLHHDEMVVDVNRAHIFHNRNDAEDAINQRVDGGRDKYFNVSIVSEDDVLLVHIMNL